MDAERSSGVAGGRSPGTRQGSDPATELADQPLARGEGFEPPTARSVAWCSASIWSAPDGSGLLTLGGPSVQTAPDGSRRIVWMIIGMVKAHSNGYRTPWVVRDPA